MGFLELFPSVCAKPVSRQDRLTRKIFLRTVCPNGRRFPSLFQTWVAFVGAFCCHQPSGFVPLPFFDVAVDQFSIFSFSAAIWTLPLLVPLRFTSVEKSSALNGYC